jgi:hypothetical protein
MSAIQPTADATTVDTTSDAGAAPAAPPVPIPVLEAQIAARRERLSKTIDELTERLHPRSILHRQTEAAKARFADVATTPEGGLRVERLAAVVAVVAVVGGLLVYRRLHRS